MSETTVAEASPDQIASPPSWIARWVRLLAPFAVLAIAVVVANSVAILVTDTNPVLQRAGLVTTQPPHVPIPGQNTIDPNDGFTVQALGTLAARDLVHGQLPLWNSYEGTGEPLAAGLQSGAFFPLTVLMLLPGGVLLFHMVLELIAAIGMYLLLRKLRISTWVAVTGGILFAVNGTFVYLTNAVFNPIAFLPWVILGVELARESTGWLRARGWWLIAISLALSLLAGFPEVAYLNTLLAVGWALVRLPGTQRKLVYLVSAGVGAVAGVLLALPALIQFVDYLPNAYLADHANGLDPVHLSQFTGLALFTPYIFGPIFAWTGAAPAGAALAPYWGSVGGYLTVGIGGLAFLGLFVRRSPLLLRLWLLVWCVLAVSRIYGVPVIGHILDLLPGMSSIAAYRYLPPSLAGAAIVLACFGLERLRAPLTRRTARLILGAVFGLGMIGLIALAVRRSHAVAGDAVDFRLTIAIWGGLGIVVAIVIAAAIMGSRTAGRIAAPVAIAEALILFIAPQLSAPVRPTVIDTAPVAFLQQNLGEQRVAGLGRLLPNYGSYFGIASVNENNLPVPLNWNNFIFSELAPHSKGSKFTGANPSLDTAVGDFVAEMANYEKLGVKYVIEADGALTDAQVQQLGLTVAFQSTGTTIYRLPDPAPYFSASGCTVTSTDRAAAKVDCPQASRLTRLETFFPGWTATVDGKPVTVTQTDGLFQTVAMPAGTHTVEFSYWPPRLTLAFGAAGLTLLLMIAAGVAPWAVRRRSSRPRV